MYCICLTTNVSINLPKGSLVHFDAQIDWAPCVGFSRVDLCAAQSFPTRFGVLSIRLAEEAETAKTAADRASQQIEEREFIDILLEEQRLTVILLIGIAALTSMVFDLLAILFVWSRRKKIPVGHTSGGPATVAAAKETNRPMTETVSALTKSAFSSTPKIVQAKRADTDLEGHAEVAHDDREHVKEESHTRAHSAGV